MSAPDPGASPLPGTRRADGASVVVQHAGERESDDDGGQCDEDDGEQASPGERHETQAATWGHPSGSRGVVP